MTPEVQILLLNVAGLALAYGLIYPAFVGGSSGGRLARFVLADLAVTAALVAGAAWLFWGQSLWFLGWYLGPIPFALITLMILEYPLFRWFANKHDLTH